MGLYIQSCINVNMNRIKKSQWCVARDSRVQGTDEASRYPTVLGRFGSKASKPHIWPVSQMEIDRAAVLIHEGRCGEFLVAKLTLKGAGMDVSGSIEDEVAWDVRLTVRNGYDWTQDMRACGEAWRNV